MCVRCLTIIKIYTKFNCSSKVRPCKLNIDLSIVLSLTSGFYGNDRSEDKLFLCQQITVTVLMLTHLCKMLYALARALEKTVFQTRMLTLFLLFQTMTKKVREKSRECQNHKPQPFRDTKRKRKPIKPNKYKSNKRTKSTKISSLFPKRGNRNAKRTDKRKNKITQG